MLKKGDILDAADRQYTVLRLIGRGANSAAYLAYCRHDGITTKCILKEFSPTDYSDFEKGKERFVNSVKLQNEIRRLNALNNQTPPVSRIFEAFSTVYADIACYNGDTLDKLSALTLPQYTEICRTIAKTVEYYHNSGYVCLDLKPENIFILQNATDDTITQLVEFIDFDSVRNLNDTENLSFSYTREWAAPEQLNPLSGRKTGKSADIYTLGEIVFFILFGRHSKDIEHRGFSKYPFDECKPEYRKFTERLDIRAMYTSLFRGTLRSSAANRFKSAKAVAEILENIIEQMRQRDYIIPKLPAVSPNFVGRENEMCEIADSLKKHRVLFVTGVGGIGKSTLIRNFILKNQTEYGVIVYLEFEGSIEQTFCDDLQLQISTVCRMVGEGTDEYFNRKLAAFARICEQKRVLFVIDNFSGRITKRLSEIINCGWDTVIATRKTPPVNSFAVMETGAIADKNTLIRLVSLNFGRQLSKEEQTCFGEIITLINGHTLVLELIARQISVGNLDIKKAVKLIRDKGFSHFSDEKICNFKDNEEVYDTLAEIISALFDLGRLSEKELTALKVLSLFNVLGLESELICGIVGIDPMQICKLRDEGWIYTDVRVRLHPVIAETVRNKRWGNSLNGIQIMDFHKKVVNIYVGMNDSRQVKKIISEAKKYKDEYPTKLVTAIYYDMLADYYDLLTGGNYIPYNENEARILQKLFNAANCAIKYAELSSETNSKKYLAKYYISMVAVLIRSVPENQIRAKRFLALARRTLNENPHDFENRCYYYMVSAWYFTLVEPNLEKTVRYTQKAVMFARRFFYTELEIIDIIYIPTANCYFHHGQLEMSAQTISLAIDICKKYPDVLAFIDKYAELASYLIDIYHKLGDTEKCHKLADEIKKINIKYEDLGIHRRLPETAVDP